MCLFTYHLKPKIADNDIICYKIVEKTKIKGVYKSKFQRFEYIIRQLYTNNINVKFVYKLTYSTFSGYAIGEGMFHSYAGYPIILSPLLNCALLKCIIPKGAYYFKGYSGNYSSYASSQIKIVEEI